MKRYMIKTVLLAACVLFLTGLPVRAANPWGTIIVDDEDTKPPVDAVINSYYAEGDVVEDIARFKCSITLSVFADGWVEIPLIKNCSVTDFTVKTGDAKKLLFTRGKDGYILLCGKPGDYALDLECVSRVESSGAQRELLVPFASAVSEQTKIIIPEEVADIEAYPEIKFSRTVREDKTEVILYGGDPEGVNLVWRIRPGITALKPLIFADQRIQAYISRGVIRANCTITYTVLQGTVDHLSLICPADCNLLEVNGDEIKTWNLGEQEGSGINPTQSGQQLEVTLAKPVQKHYTLTASLERPLDNLPGEGIIPSLTVNGVKREQGIVSIYAQKGLKIEPGTVSGASQFDVHEIKEEKADADFRLGLAYKYLKRPFSLGIAVSLIQPKVSAQTETLALVSRELIRAENIINYTIQDAGIFKLRFTLEDDCKLVDIKGNNINNWRIKDNLVTVDLRAAAEGSYRLSVEVEKPTGGQENVTLPTLTLLDVTRQTGFIAVSPRLDTKVEAVSSSGASQIDIKDLPGSLKRVREGISLAYRYIRYPYTVEISIGQIQPEVYAEVYSRFNIKEKELIMDTQMLFDIRKAGIFELRIAFPSRLRLVDTVHGDFIEDWRIDTQKELLVVNFRSKVDGKYTLTLSATTSLDDLASGIELPVLLVHGAKKERGHVSVQTETSIRIKTDHSENVSEIDIMELPDYFKLGGGEIALAYKYFRQPWAVKLSVEPIEPVVTAEVFNLASIGEGLEQISSRIDYTIQFAGVAHFDLQLPSGAKNVNITGGNLKHWEENADTPGEWNVELQAKIRGNYVLYVAFEHTMDSASGDIEFRGIKTLGLEREKGYVAVNPYGNVEIIPLEENIKGVAPIDSTEIPSQFRQGITVPIIWAFKYISHPYSIGLSVIKHLDVEALVTMAESASLVTLVSEEGETINDLTLILKNTRKQFLRIMLPAGTNVLDAFVGDRSVQLGETEIQVGENKERVTMIPISGAAQPGAHFPVKILYEKKHHDLGYRGRLTMECPRVDVPVMRLAWDLYLPKNYKLNLVSGDLRQIEHTSYIWSGVQQRQKEYFSQVQTKSSGKRQMDFNIIQQNLEKQQLGQGKAVFSGGRSAVSQNLIELLRRGKVFHFEKLIAVVPGGGEKSTFMVPGVLSVRYVKGALNTVSAGIIFLLFIVGSITMQIVKQFRKLAFPLAATLVLTALHLLRPDFYPHNIQWAIGTLWLIFIIGLLYSSFDVLSKVMQARRKSKKKSPEKRWNTTQRKIRQSFLVAGDVPPEGSGTGSPPPLAEDVPDMPGGGEGPGASGTPEKQTDKPPAGKSRKKGKKEPKKPEDK